MTENYTLAQHASRLDNIKRANEDIHRCEREMRIENNYLPGQIIYYLGDYPAPMSISPTDYDFKLLQSYAENGVGLIQVHEEWNDTIRRFGHDKYSSCDPEGMRRFIELCHYFGIKIIPYCSSSYIHRYDPDYTEDFSRCEKGCTDMHYSYRFGCAGSAKWRNFIIPKTFQILDNYDFDGIFNDCGYDWVNSKMKDLPDNRQNLTNAPIPQYDPEAEDLIHILYDGVHSRGGIYKLHIGWNKCPPIRGKCYDYLWIGEGEHKSLCGAGKYYEPYVIPCQDKPHLPYYDPDEFFAMTIPFVQFPLLTHGRPTMGKCIDVPGVTQYNTDRPERLYHYFERVRDFADSHPDGPYIYSEWSNIPDDVEDYPRWCRYLALYKPMVEEQSVVWMEVRDTSWIVSEIPENVFVSVFVNDKTYMAVSNMEDSPYTIRFAESWTDRVTGITSKSFTVQPHRIGFFVKA